MLRNTLRLALIIAIVYMSFLGGAIETHPFLKIGYQVGMASILGIWLITLWLRGQGFPVTPLDAPLLALALAAMLAAIFAADARVSGEHAWRILAHIMLFYVAVDLMRSGYGRWLFEGLFIMAGVTIVIALLEMLVWYFGLGVRGYLTQGWIDIGGLSLPPTVHEVSLPLGHNNPTGMTAVLLVPLLFAWALTVRQRDLRAGLFLLVAGMAAVIILTQSRGAYLAFAGALGISALVVILHPDIRGRVPAWLRPLVQPRVVIVAALAGALLAVVILYALIILPEKPNPNDICRLDLWQSAIRMFRDRPLLGVGPGVYQGFRLYYSNWPYSPSYLSLEHPHNLLLTIMAEGGVLGLAAIAWIGVRFGRVWWAGWQGGTPSVRRRFEAILVLMAAFMLHNLVDAFYKTQHMIVLAIVAAYVVTKADSVPLATLLPGLKARRRVVALAGMALVIV